MVNERKPITKIKDLLPESKQVNILARVVSVGETREIPSRYGPSRKVAEAVIGDETATIILSLWQEQIGTVTPNDVLYIDNGYVSLVKGRMRLNVGKYGKIIKAQDDVKVNSSVDMSAKEYPFEPRRRGLGTRERTKTLF